MAYRIREGFDQRKGVISNSHGFLAVYLDGGFKEKWSGYWSPSHKYLDYLATKINGIWLTAETLEEVMYGDKITYRHHTSGLEITQEITAPENLSGFKVEYSIKNRADEQKAVRTSVEAGVDIRPKTEDLGGTNYQIDTSNAGMKISKEDRWFSISSDKFRFEENSYIKEHSPGEKQECIIPGEIFQKCEIEPGEEKNAELVFKTEDKAEVVHINSVGELRHHNLSRAYNYCLESLENLYYHRNGPGIIAGHPWFQNYWARDSFWAALGMIDAGMFEEVEKLLLNFSSREDFPSKIRTDGGIESDYPRFDTVPLFAIAVDKLDRYYGAEKELLDRAEELLSEERPEGQIVDHEASGTWMDTLDRNKAVDIQSLWIEALDRFNRGTKRLEKGLNKFEEPDYIKDNLEDNFESVNPAVTLMFGQIDKSKAQKYLEKINGEFSSRFGARTRAVTDHGYNPSGYHTGSVWGLTTCWAAAANLQYGNEDHGVNFLRKLTQFLDRNQLGALPEVVNAESGESLGCDEQAWSAGMFVHVIDSYLLGLEVKDGRVIIDPADELSLTRKSKRIGDQEIDLKVNNGEVEILNEPELEIETR